MGGEPAQIEALNNISTAFMASRALHVLADLGVADLIDDAPERPDVLAAKLAVNADALARIMRYLSSHGVFEEPADGQFAHSPLSRFMRSDHPLPQRAWIRMIGYGTWDIASNSTIR